MSTSSFDRSVDPVLPVHARADRNSPKPNGHENLTVAIGTRDVVRSARRAAFAVGTRPPKVLFANKFFFLNGGSEAVMFDEMAILKRSGAEVLEISMHDPRNLASNYASYFVSPKPYRASSGLDRVRSALSIIHSREAVRNITKLIHDEKPDIVHCHNIYHQLTPSIITAAARLRVPVVLTLHDYKIVCPVYTQLRRGEPCTQCSGGRFESVLAQRCADGSIGRSALLWAEARYHAALGSYGRVDTFIAPSRFMRDAVIRRVGEGGVAHIPNGIDIARIKPVENDEGYVLYAGRLTPEKGIETLLRTYAQDGAAWRLVVAGTGPLLEKLRSQFPQAEFTGHLTGGALQAVLDRAALIAVPSEWHENCPISILEAMARAKPVVASRIGGIPELVRDGETGLLFEPKNTEALSRHIKALLASSELRKRLGRNARRIVETEYTFEVHGAALLSLYQRLIERNRSYGSRGA
jgi:glycosyltransferase involved in cell wall biosynthesis